MNVRPEELQTAMELMAQVAELRGELGAVKAENAWLRHVIERAAVGEDSE